ncbi:PARP-domain-containing protein [Apiospora sp. TS-2023a]
MSRNPLHHVQQQRHKQHKGSSDALGQSRSPNARSIDSRCKKVSASGLVVTDIPKDDPNCISKPPASYTKESRGFDAQTSSVCEKKEPLPVCHGNTSAIRKVYSSQEGKNELPPTYGIKPYKQYDSFMDRFQDVEDRWQKLGVLLTICAVGQGQVQTDWASVAKEVGYSSGGTAQVSVRSDPIGYHSNLPKDESKHWLVKRFIESAQSCNLLPKCTWIRRTRNGRIRARASEIQAKFGQVALDEDIASEEDADGEDGDEASEQGERPDQGKAERESGSELGQDAHLNYDVNKLPLGKLSKSTILRGFQALKDLSELLGDPASAQASHGMTFDDAKEALSNTFFTLIPHAFGRARPPVEEDTPCGRPLAFAYKRGQLADALQFEKNHEGFLHTTDNVAKGTVLDATTSPHMRIEDGVIRTTIGGGKRTARGRTAVQEEPRRFSSHYRQCREGHGTRCCYLSPYKERGCEGQLLDAATSPHIRIEDGVISTTIGGGREPDASERMVCTKGRADNRGDCCPPEERDGPEPPDTGPWHRDAHDIGRRIPDRQTNGRRTKEEEPPTIEESPSIYLHVNKSTIYRRRVRTRSNENNGMVMKPFQLRIETEEEDNHRCGNSGCKDRGSTASGLATFALDHQGLGTKRRRVRVTNGHANESRAAPTQEPIQSSSNDQGTSMAADFQPNAAVFPSTRTDSSSKHSPALS